MKYLLILMSCLIAAYILINDLFTVKVIAIAFTILYTLVIFILENSRYEDQ